jgi:hypothetical protein
MYKYTEQATIQWAIPGLLRGPANGRITAHRPAAMCCILFAPMAGCAAPELADLCAYGRRVMPD